MTIPHMENPNELVMPVYEMHSSSDFCIGKSIPRTGREPIKKVFIGINSQDLLNGNTVVVGMSGSYKTTLLKEMIRDFANKNLTVHVIDLQGDMFVPEETLCIKVFINGTSSCGGGSVNLFEFDKMVGGPKSNIKTIISILKKSIMPQLGVIQTSVLRKVLKDFYTYYGIDENDKSTWGNDVPNMEKFVKFYKKLYKYIQNKEDDIEKLVKKIDALAYKITKMKKDDIYTDDEIEKYEEKLAQLEEELVLEAKNYTEKTYRRMESKLELNSLKYEKSIDLDYYRIKKNFSAFESLSTLVEELDAESIFKGDLMSVATSGVVRYDLSDLTSEGKPTSAILFVEILLNQIFRYTKSRGLYSNLKRKIGKKYDTALVMDESKLTLPTGTDKDNSFVLQHRIVSEGRKYGLFAVWASQMAKSFSQEILMNSAVKIILKVDSVQRKQIQLRFGIKDKDLLDYIKTPGVALIDIGKDEFIPVALPFADKKSFNKTNTKAPF